MKTPNDETLFNYYCTSQLLKIDFNGNIKPIGQTAIFYKAAASPDGKYILTSRIHTPYSYLYPSNRFPKEMEVWDTNGKMIYKVLSSPLQDKIPNGGTQTGPRSISWSPVEPATLIWAEALDG